MWKYYSHVFDEVKHPILYKAEEVIQDYGVFILILIGTIIGIVIRWHCY